jgi:general secretion pathway protein H
MPTSPPGNRPPANAGFTLVEALIAIGVIALMASLVLFAMPGPERQARQMAERFAAFVARGGEESVMTNRPLALRITAEGYGFEARAPSGWAPTPPGDPLAFRRWPQGVQATVAEGLGPGQTEGHALVFDVLGAASPAEVRLASAGQIWRVRVNSNGQVDVAPIS